MESLSDGFKALADPNRLRLIGLLRDGELCVCDLMAALEMPQSTVSRHLSYLKKEKWVSGRRCGKWMYYRLATPCEPILVEVMEILRHGIGDYEIIMQDQEKLRQHLKIKPSNSCR